MTCRGNHIIRVFMKEFNYVLHQLCFYIYMTSFRFSFDRRKVIGFTSTKLHDWLKKLVSLLIQSEVKPKPIVNHSPSFSCTLRQLHVIMWWVRVLIGSLFCLYPLWLARVITVVLVLRHSCHSIKQIIVIITFCFLFTAPCISWLKERAW